MSRPKLLDLFCCEGGASMGSHRAGFEVFGVDLFKDHSRKRYPFPAHQGDALTAIEILMRPGRWLQFDGGVCLGMQDFDAITASPPCQRYSITNAARKADYPDLIWIVRELLKATGKPYVIENVEGAPLENPIELCGCMFGLSAIDDDGIKLHLQRTRLFESNVPLEQPAHDHSDHEWVGGCYGGARRDKYEAKYVRKGGYVPPNKAVVEAYMGIDWMTWKGLHQAIPPVYTEFIGRQLMSHLDNNTGGKN